jgi:hypothetical protein
LALVATDFRYPSRHRGFDLHLHFHALQHNQNITSGDDVTHLLLDLTDGAGNMR